MRSRYDPPVTIKATDYSVRDENEDQGQEPELTRFYRLDHSWSFDGEDHVISVAAYKLHLAGTADSVTGGHPGSVPDEYLSSPGPGTAIAVMELVTSGYWERATAATVSATGTCSGWRWSTSRCSGTARRSGNKRAPAPSRTRY